jgi:hypothetical protein
MNFRLVIPQLFYDLIGRIVPGSALIGFALAIYFGPACAANIIMSWSLALTVKQANGFPSVFVLLGNLVAAYIVGSLLGGVWFFIHTWYRHKIGDEMLKESLVDLIGHMENLDQTGKKCNQNMIRFIRSEKTSPTKKIALMYDYIHLSCPNAAARMAKLRAELHMSGVLFVGFIVMSFLELASPVEFNLLLVEILTIGVAVVCASLAKYLDDRSLKALLFNWYLSALCGVTEKKEDD